MEEELKQRVEQIERDLNELKAVGGIQLKAPVSTETSKTVTDLIKDNILDIVWNDYFYYSSTFESIDRYYTTGLGAANTVNADGLFLQTTAVLGNIADSALYVTSDKTISSDRVARFRTVARVDVVANQNTGILTLSSAGGYVGFKFIGSTIKGVCQDGTTEQTFDIGTAVNDTYVKLELQYFPGQKVEFYVNEIFKGALSRNLPSLYTDTNMIMFAASIEATTASAHELTVEYFEFLQRRK